MMQYIKAVLLLMVALGVVIFAFGLGIVAVLTVMIMLPLLRFFITRKGSGVESAQYHERVIEAEYEIITDQPKELRQEEKRKKQC